MDPPVPASWSWTCAVTVSVSCRRLVTSSGRSGTRTISPARRLSSETPFSAYLDGEDLVEVRRRCDQVGQERQIAPAEADVAQLVPGVSRVRAEPPEVHYLLDVSRDAGADRLASAFEVPAEHRPRDRCAGRAAVGGVELVDAERLVEGVMSDVPKWAAKSLNSGGGPETGR
jgi:hypothetical protein